VWLQGKSGALKPGRAMVLLPIRERETDASPVAYLAPLRSTLIDRNRGHVNVVVCEDDYRALKCGIENLKPAAVGRVISLSPATSAGLFEEIAAEPGAEFLRVVALGKAGNDRVLIVPAE